MHQELFSFQLSTSALCKGIIFCIFVFSFICSTSKISEEFQKILLMFPDNHCKEFIGLLAYVGDF